MRGAPEVALLAALWELGARSEASAEACHILLHSQLNEPKARTVLSVRQREQSHKLTFSMD